MLASYLASPDVLAALAKTPLARITTLALVGFDIVAKDTVSAIVVNGPVHGIVGSSLFTCIFQTSKRKGPMSVGPECGKPLVLPNPL